MPSSRGSSQPRDQTRISCFSCIAGRFFTAETPGKPYNMDTNLLFRFRALTSASVQFWLLPAYSFPLPWVALVEGSHHAQNYATLPEAALIQ